MVILGNDDEINDTFHGNNGATDYDDVDYDDQNDVDDHDKDDNDDYYYYADTNVFDAAYDTDNIDTCRFSSVRRLQVWMISLRL